MANAWFSRLILSKIGLNLKQYYLLFFELLLAFTLTIVANLLGYRNQFLINLNFKNKGLKLENAKLLILENAKFRIR